MILSDAASPDYDGELLGVKKPDRPSGSPLTAINHSKLTTTDCDNSILQAAADAALGPSGADGIAVALRDGDLVLCRARSGEMAPPLGSTLSIDSGFSGECFRSAQVLVCSDTQDDSRVNAEVCRELGIRSIAAIPLKGASGVIGIMEAFSGRSSAFGDEQVSALGDLAEVIEAACEGEPAPPDPIVAPVSPPAPIQTLLPALPLINTVINTALKPALRDEPIFEALKFGTLKTEEPLKTNPLERPSSKRRYWLPSLAIVVIALIAWVLWLGWQDPSELEASEPTIDSMDTSNQFPVPSKPPKPEAGLTRPHSGAGHAIDLVKNAAKIEAEPRAGAVTVADASATPLPGRGSDRRGDPAADVPPPVIMATTEPRVLLPSLPSTSNVMPSLGVKISQGVTEGALIHQVQPAYPTEALQQRLKGSVVLDVTIKPDGSIQDVKVVSGPSVLAAAATEAVRQWRYSPSLLNGSPIQVQKRVTVAFKLP